MLLALLSEWEPGYRWGAGSHSDVYLQVPGASCCGNGSCDRCGDRPGWFRGRGGRGGPVGERRGNQHRQCRGPDRYGIRFAAGWSGGGLVCRLSGAGGGTVDFEVTDTTSSSSPCSSIAFSIDNTDGSGGVIANGTLGRVVLTNNHSRHRGRMVTTLRSARSTAARRAASLPRIRWRSCRAAAALPRTPQPGR